MFYILIFLNRKKWNENKNKTLQEMSINFGFIYYADNRKSNHNKRNRQFKKRKLDFNHFPIKLTASKHHFHQQVEPQYV